MTAAQVHKHLVLSELFRRADAAGLGIADDASFEAFPTLEDASATYMESILDDVLRWADGVMEFWPQVAPTDDGTVS